MAIHHEQLPRDGNGIVQGAYRIVHEDPAFTGPIGIYDVVDGLGQQPACGRALRCAVGEYGTRLYLEPWGPLPVDFALPELVSGDVPDEVVHSLQRAPWRQAAAPVAPIIHPVPETAPSEAPDDLDGMSRDDLLALAELQNISIDRRWGETRLRRALAEAGITGV